MSDTTCVLCRKRSAVKTDGLCRPVCGRCAAGLPEPIINAATPTGRNHSCPCGSGKKFKRCCRLIPAGAVDGAQA